MSVVEHCLEQLPRGLGRAKRGAGDKSYRLYLYPLSLALSLWDAYKDVGGSATQDAKAERG
jgi:hypothetical protein